MDFMEFVLGVLLLAGVGLGAFYMCLVAYREGVNDGILMGATMQATMMEVQEEEGEDNDDREGKEIHP